MWPFSRKYQLPKLPALPAPSDLALPGLDEERVPEFPVPSYDAPADQSILPPHQTAPAATPFDPPTPIPRRNVEPPLPQASSDTAHLGGISLWLSNGLVIKSLPELAQALRAMSDATFHFHVTPERNDLTSWISDILGDRALAMALSPIHKREDFLHVLEKHLTSLPKPDTKQFAYLGLRGMASTLDGGVIGYQSKDEDRMVPVPKHFELHDDPASARRAISELSSMEDPTSLITRLQPKGSMLSQMLAEKKARKAAIIPEHQLLLPTHPDLLEITSAVSAQQRTLPTPRSAPARKAPKTIPKAVLPKKGSKEDQKALHQLALMRLKEAKQKARARDIPGARSALKEARAIIRAKLPSGKRTMQYELWDAENALKQAALA